MNDNSIYCTRKINTINQETPLLIPSFSSVLDEKIGLVHERLRNRIPSASLVSAYDVAYNLINKDTIWASDVVVIDSGNYEYTNLCNSTLRKKWCAEDYLTFISTLKPLSKVIIVNYDEKIEIDSQILRAKELFKNIESYAKCFLYKPVSGYFDLEEYVSKIDQLSDFDVLGITEKELGCSIVERCVNLMKLRQVLNRKKLEHPIHIFGCIDPIGVLLFFLSGADMFDGTNWLKLSFDNNLAVYQNNAAVLSKAWYCCENALSEFVWVENLHKLTKLTLDLKKYTKENDFNIFGIETKLERNIKDIITKAQSKIKG